MRGQWCGNSNPHGSHTWYNSKIKETVHCNGTNPPKKDKPKKKGR